LAEACARLASFKLDQSRVVDLVLSGVLVLAFEVNRNSQRVARLMKKYADRPMDLADACLVVMAESFADSVVLTLDAKDFSVYRQHDRQIVLYISPPRR
jgi:predicted nucleic acid-binding protein